MRPGRIAAGQTDRTETGSRLTHGCAALTTSEMVSDAARNLWVGSSRFHYAAGIDSRIGFGERQDHRGNDLGLSKEPRLGIPRGWGHCSRACLGRAKCPIWARAVEVR